MAPSTTSSTIMHIAQKKKKKHRKLWPNYFKCRKWQNSFPLLNFQLLKIRSAMQKHLGLPVDGVIKRTCFFGSFLWHRHLTWLTCGLYPYHDVHIDRQLYNTDTYYVLMSKSSGVDYWLEIANRYLSDNLFNLAQQKTICWMRIVVNKIQFIAAHHKTFFKTLISSKSAAPPVCFTNVQVDRIRIRHSHQHIR